MGPHDTDDFGPDAVDQQVAAALDRAREYLQVGEFESWLFRQPPLEPVGMAGTTFTNPLARFLQEPLTREYAGLLVEVSPFRLTLTLSGQPVGDGLPAWANALLLAIGYSHRQQAPVSLPACLYLLWEAAHPREEEDEAA